MGYGVVYLVNNSDLPILDSHMLMKNRFSRIEVTVQDKKGNSYNCFTYKNNEKMSGTDIFSRYKRFLPSRQYRNCVIKGAKQQKLSKEYIEKLRSISPLISDKIGSQSHRNTAIGTFCDKNSLK